MVRSVLFALTLSVASMLPAHGAGPEAVPVPGDLPVVAPDPPPPELLHTAYDMWHSMGIDLAPYTRLYEVLRDRALERIQHVQHRHRIESGWQAVRDARGDA